MKILPLLLLAAFELTGCVGQTKEEAAAFQKMMDESDQRFKKDLAELEAKNQEIRERPKKRQQKREEYVNAHPKLSASIRKDILKGVVTIGMTAEQVRASYGGEEPDKINRSVYSWGIQEQWIYGEQYLYLKDGKLDSWQEASR